MPKNNARENVHTKKRAKLRLKIWALKETLQAPPKITLKPKRPAAVTAAK